MDGVSACFSTLDAVGEVICECGEVEDAVVVGVNVSG